MNKKPIWKTLAASLLLLALTALTVSAWHADVALSLLNSYRAGTLTAERFRYELAAFNLGQKNSVVPLDSRVSPLDGMTQVYVPEGKFLMGDPDETGGKAPAHTVYLDSFWMDRIEVTNSMYEKCVAAGSCTLPTSVNPYYGQWVYRDHPMVYVTWFQAEAYCQWAGRRLPTEAEWEKAARGPDGRPYPWGDTPPNPRLANFDQTLRGEAASAYRYPLGASPYGVLNMSGNVREWVADWFAADYYQHSPSINPQGPAAGTERSLRSGSYNEDAKEIAIYRRYNHDPKSPGLSRGFRCAQSAE